MTVAARGLALEVLRFPGESGRAARALEAVARPVPHDGAHVAHRRAYQGGADWLVLWGPGAPDRQQAMRRQLGAGGHVLALDLAYWQRESHFRVSIDAAHPQAWVMRRTRSAERLERAGVRLEDRWDPAGAAIVAGIGDKAGVQYGTTTVRAWELEQIAQLRAAGVAVRYRPKKPLGWVPDGVPRAAPGPIDDVLTGAALVVTWHSNVAVDAIRLGIPAVCVDGAAAAVCPNGWGPGSPGLEPMPVDVRRQFLANLAYFQWSPHDVSGLWPMLTELVA